MHSATPVTDDIMTTTTTTTEDTMTTTTTEDTMPTTTTATATEAYVAAAAAAEVAEAAYDDATCSEACAATPDDHLPDCPNGLALAALHAAQATHDAAREAWLASDEPRDWEVRDDQASDTLHDVAPDDVEAEIETWLTDGDWDTSEGPLHLVAWAYPIDPTTGEACAEGRVEGEVTIEQDEPACADGEDHEWRTPHSVLGGLAENPGVWGAGAGIVSREVCAHCGAYRVYESARQDGSGGYHEATSYEEADEDSLEWVAARRRKARIAELVTELEDEYEEDALRAAIGTALDADEDATEDDVRARLDEDEDEDEEEVAS